MDVPQDSETDPLIIEIITNIRTDDWEQVLHLLNGNIDYILNKYAPIHWAAYYGSKNTMSALLQAGAQPDLFTEDIGKSTAIILATRNKKFEVLSMLLYYSNDAINFVDGNSYTALHYAVQISEPSYVQLLLEFGADSNQKTSFDWNSLQLCEDPQSAELLIQAGVDVNHADKVGLTPLHNAAAKGKVTLLQLLLESGANADATTEEQVTPLMLAAKDGNHECVSLLLKHKADPRKANFNGDTALHEAALTGNPKGIKLLLDANVDPKAVNSRFENALHMVSSQDAAQLLVDEVSVDMHTPDSDGNTPLHMACWTDNVEPEVCLVIIEAGGSLQGKNAKGQTPFLLACARGDPYILELLADCEVDMFAADDYGFTGIHYAAASGSVECVQFLFDRQLDINAESIGDRITPLHNTMSAEVAKYLLENGARVNAKDANGNLPIHKAVDRADNVELVNLYLDFNSHLNPQNAEGETPLHIASINNHGNCVFLLLQKGADTTIFSKAGYQPLHSALVNTSKFCAKLLIDVGAVDLHVCSVNEKWEPLHIVNTEDTAKHLLKKKANLQARDANRNTPLHCVCFKGAVEIAEVFIAKGAKINVANKEGVTPLIFAAQQGYASLVGALLEGGADANVIDHKGNKAVDYVDKMLDAKATITDQDLLLDYQDSKEWLDQYTKKDLTTDTEDREEEEEIRELQAQEEADEITRRKMVAKRAWRKLKLKEKDDTKVLEDGTVVKHQTVGRVMDGLYKVRLESLRMFLNQDELSDEMLQKRQQQMGEQNKQAEAHFKIFVQIFDNDEDDELKKYMVDHDIDANMKLYNVSILHEAVSRGALKCVQTMCDLNGVLINERDDNNHTPIRLAQLNKNKEIFRVLAMAGADLVSEDEQGWTLLHHAATMDPQWVKMVLTNWNSDAAKVSYRSALRKAQRQYLTEHKDDNESSSSSSSSSSSASDSASSDANDTAATGVSDPEFADVTKVLDREWEFPSLNQQNMTVQVNGMTTKFEKWSVLHCVRDAEIAKLLMGLGADVNHQDDDGNTPLMNIIDSYNPPKGDEKTPEQQEEEMERKQRIKEIQDRKKGKEKALNGDSDGNTSDNDKDNDSDNEDKDKDKDPLSSSGQAALPQVTLTSTEKERLAAQKELEELKMAEPVMDIELVQTFVENEDIDLSFRNKDGDTALILAVRVQVLEYVKSLLKADAMVSVPDNHNKNPLHIAAELGNSAILGELIQYSYKELDTLKQMASQPGKTPLHYVTDVKSAEMLIEAASDFGWLTSIDTGGRTPLHEHCRRRNDDTDIIQLLLDAGAPVEGYDAVSEVVLVDTPLMMACAKGKAKKVDLLLDFDALPFLVNKQGKMALHFAVSSCNQECVKLVLAAMSKSSLRRATSTAGLVKSSWIRSIPSVDPPNSSIQVHQGNFEQPEAYATQSQEELRDEINRKLAQKLQLKESMSEKAKEEERRRQKQLFAANKYVQQSIEQAEKEKEELGSSSSDEPEEETKTPEHEKILKDVISDDTRPLLVDSVTTYERWSPLHLAKTSGIVRLLIQSGANVNIVDANNMRPTHIAAATGLHDVLADLITLGGASINSSERERTALMLAAQAGHMECVQLLLDHGADVYALDPVGQSASEYATNAGLDEIALFLDNKKVLDPSSMLYRRDDDVEEHRQVAVRRRPAPAVERKKKRVYHTKGSFLRFMSSMIATKFLVRGISGKRNDTNDLYHAIRADDATTFRRAYQVLIDDDGPQADLNPTFYGWPLTHWACFHGAINVVKVMIQYKVDLDTLDANNTTGLCWACFSGYFELVALLMEQNVNPVNKDSLWGANPLHFAAQGASSECVAHLLEKKQVDVNSTTLLHGYTPMHFVSSRGIAEMLVNAGADLDIGSLHGLSPLHTAARFGRYEVLQYFLSTELDVDSKTLENDTALMKSSQYPNHHDCVALLLKHGSNPNEANANGDTALHFATYYDCHRSVEHLIKGGADVNAVDRKLISPLHNACSSGNYETVKLILSHPCDADIPDLDGLTPVMRACEMGHFRIVKYLVTDVGVNIHTKTEEGDTLLHIACDFMYWNIVSFLLDVGADVNVVNQDGISPLHLACKYGHVELTNLLLSFGANALVKDVAGNTPLHYAIFSQLILFQGKKLKDAEVEKMSSTVVEICNVMMEVQAPVLEANKRGHTPMDFAMKIREMGSKSRAKQVKLVQKKREEIVEILKTQLSQKSKMDVEYRYAQRRSDYFARIFRDLDEFVFHDMDHTQVQRFRTSTVFGNSVNYMNLSEEVARTLGESSDEMDRPGTSSSRASSGSTESKQGTGGSSKKKRSKNAIRHYRNVHDKKRKAIFIEDMYHDLLLSLAAQFTQSQGYVEDVDESQDQDELNQQLESVQEDTEAELEAQKAMPTLEEVQILPGNDEEQDKLQQQAEEFAKKQAQKKVAKLEERQATSGGESGAAPNTPDTPEWGEIDDRSALMAQQQNEAKRVEAEKKKRQKEYSDYQLAQAEAMRERQARGQQLNTSQMQYFYFVPGVPKMRPQRRQRQQQVMRSPHQQHVMQLKNDYEFMSTTSDKIRSEHEEQHSEEQKRLAETQARQLLMLQQQHQQQVAQLQTVNQLFANSPNRRGMAAGKRFKAGIKTKQGGGGASGPQMQFMAQNIMQQQQLQLQRQRAALMEQQRQRQALEQEHRAQMERLKAQQKRHLERLESQYGKKKESKKNKGKSGGKKKNGNGNDDKEARKAQEMKKAGKSMQETEASARWTMLHDAQQYRHSMMEGHELPKPPKRVTMKDGVFAKVQAGDWTQTRPRISNLDNRGHHQGGGRGGVRPHTMSHGPRGHMNSPRNKMRRVFMDARAFSSQGMAGQSAWTRPMSRSGQTFGYQNPNQPMPQSPMSRPGTSFSRGPTGRFSTEEEKRMIQTSSGNRRPKKMKKARKGKKLSKSKSMYDERTGRRIKNSRSQRTPQRRSRLEFHEDEHEFGDHEEDGEVELIELENEEEVEMEEELELEMEGDGLDWLNIPDIRTDEDIEEAEEREEMKRKQEAKERRRKSKMKKKRRKELPPPTPLEERTVPTPKMVKLRDPYEYLKKFRF